MISPDEFNRIYDQYVDAVFCLAMRSVSRREIAEEITSDVFLTLYQSAQSIHHDQLPARLFTVAKRRAADYWRRWYLERRWRNGSANPDQAPAIQPHPEIPFEDILARCPSLKPIHRTCLILRFVQRMSREEIAAQIGLTELQVKGHLQYGLKLLHDVLAAPKSTSSPAQELPADA
jgi:RNA polymerase sigma-70 factor (ECF subfamily)